MKYSDFIICFGIFFLWCWGCALSNFSGVFVGFFWGVQVFNILDQLKLLVVVNIKLQKWC